MIALQSHEQWFAPGQLVCVLFRAPGAIYSAAETTVTRVTKAQIVTEDGRKFWRKTGQLVGETTRKLTYGRLAETVRIVPLDNVNAVKAREEGSYADLETSRARRERRDQDGAAS